MGSLFASVSWRWHKDLARHPQALRTPFDDAMDAAMWRVVSLPIRMDGDTPHWRDLRGVVAVCLREHGFAAECRATADSVEMDVATSDHLGEPRTTRLALRWDPVSSPRALVLDLAVKAPPRLAAGGVDPVGEVDDDGLPWMTLAKARRGIARILGDGTFTAHDDSRAGRVTVVVRDEVPAAKMEEAHRWLADRMPVHVAAVFRRESEGPYRGR